MFEVPELNNLNKNENYSNTGQQFIKDKRTSFNTMSFINNKSPLQTSQPKRTNSSASSLADRQDRTNKIISIIKDKKALPENQTGVSIKDISLSFTDCSEKTIQRELNSLVAKGQLKKTGAKRWSRYAVITTPI
jgi:Fic family protein